MKKIVLLLVDYLKYPSTISGIIKTISGISGLSLSTDLATQIVSAGVAIAGIISILLSDSDVKPTVPAATASTPAA